MTTYSHYLVMTCCLSLLVLNTLATDVDNSYYTMKIVIKTKSQNKPATLTPTPVYGNKNIAFSMRWDDCNKSNFTMQELMYKYGIKGTFYLNARRFDFKKACGKGTDIGAHSMTHPSLTNLNNNQIFQEVAEIKPYLESRADRPINSYCFSFGNYSTKVNKKVGYDIAEMLQRVGYNHNPYWYFIKKYTVGKDPVAGFRQIVPGDKQPSMAKFEQELNKLLANPAWQEDNPNISIGIHVWMKTSAAWQNIENILKKYSNRQDWWYTTQTEYAAYRKLFKLFKFKELSRTPQRIEYEITLPYAADIGSNQPLTLCYSGNATTVLVDGKSIKFSNESGKTFFDITPPPFAGIPQLISYATNKSNRPTSDIAIDNKTALRPWLYLKNNGTLMLRLENTSLAKLSQIKIKYIIPLMYKTQKATRPVNLLAGINKTITVKLALTNRQEDHYGMPFLLCQIDYLNNGIPERAYASTYGKKKLPPINNGFRDQALISQPFAGLDDLKVKLRKMSSPGSLPIADLQWLNVVEPERLRYLDYVASPLLRQPKQLRKFNKQKPYIALNYSFQSTINGTFYLETKRNLLRAVVLCFVNGQEITIPQLWKFKVNRGKNRLVIVYKSTRQLPRYVKLQYVIKKGQYYVGTKKL